MSDNGFRVRKTGQVPPPVGAGVLIPGGKIEMPDLGVFGIRATTRGVVEFVIETRTDKMQVFLKPEMARRIGSQLIEEAEKVSG